MGVNHGKETVKTRVPQQQRGIETRNRIIEAARVLFSRDGYNGTNAKEIIAKAAENLKKAKQEGKNRVNGD